MKFFMLILLCISLCTALWAQGDAPDCKQCWSVTDVNCDDHTDCTDWSQAVSQRFTPPCDGDYTFKCKTVCDEPGECHNCITCSRIVDAATGQVLYQCYTVIDVAGGCENPCENSVYPTVSLTANHDYRLEVSLQRCRDILYCGSCTCYAEAHVYYPGAACPDW